MLHSVYTHERERERGGKVILYSCALSFCTTDVSVHYVLQHTNRLSYTKFRLLYISLRACACQLRVQCCNLSLCSHVGLCSYLSIFIIYFPFYFIKVSGKGKRGSPETNVKHRSCKADMIEKEIEIIRCAKGGKSLTFVGHPLGFVLLS